MRRDMDEFCMEEAMEQKFQEIRRVKAAYPPGTSVQLVRMKDIQAPPVGTLGIVRHVDDMGTIHVAWESGGSLGLVPGEDRWAVIGRINCPELR